MGGMNKELRLFGLKDFEEILMMRKEIKVFESRK